MGNRLPDTGDYDFTRASEAPLSSVAGLEMNCIDIRNAELRAQWYLRYLTHVKCADPWPEGVRKSFDAFLAHERNLARCWMAERNKQRRISEESRKRGLYKSLRGNLVAFAHFKGYQL